MADAHTTLDAAKGDTWRVLRKNMSPAFSSGKLKGMMEPMESVCNDMTDFIKEEILNGKCQDRDVKEIFTG